VPLDPLGYLEFLSLNDRAQIVLTDSGGIQEETTVLGVPCLTLRENTERPATVEHGTNQIVGVNSDNIFAAAQSILRSPARPARRPPLWDGNTASRIVTVIQQYFAGI
jgi:UDP-N-acetylglucosamine 2-epimerase (non-hydrolysing)